MQSRIAVLPMLVALAVSAVVGTASSGAAQASTPDCTYTPALPQRVVIDKSSVTFHTPVRIVGAGCSSNFGAQESLKHHSDNYTLSWLYNSRTATNTAYAVTVKPGTYKTAGPKSCSTTATDGSNLTCKVGDGSTIIKFGGGVHLAVSRGAGSKKSQLDFTTKATRFTAAGSTGYETVQIAIQRYSSGKWHTIHSAKAKGKQGYSWSEKDSDSARYRAISGETSAVFGGMSKIVTE